MFFKTSVALYCVLSTFNVNAAVTLKKCPSSDSSCILESFKSAYRQISAGVPEAGVESSDPMTLKLVNADLAGLQYKFNDVTFKGFKNCDIKTASVDLQKNKLVTELHCPFDIRGRYFMKGRIIVLPVEGDGDFHIDVKKMSLKVNADLEQVDGSTRKYINIKKFTLVNDAIDTVVFDFKNLFGGNKGLSDTLHKFVNGNYRIVTKELSGPLFNAALKQLIKNFNKYLKTVPINKLV